MGRCLDHVAAAAWQALLVFCVVAYAGTLSFAAVEGVDDLFRSDDCYLIGMFFGSVPAAGAGLFTLVRRATGSAKAAHAVCAAALALWCGYLGVGSLSANEGREIFLFLAVGSPVAALVGWPMFGWRFPAPVAAVVLLAGYVLLLAYGAVVLR